MVKPGATLDRSFDFLVKKQNEKRFMPFFFTANSSILAIRVGIDRILSKVLPFKCLYSQLEFQLQVIVRYTVILVGPLTSPGF